MNWDIKSIITHKSCKALLRCTEIHIIYRKAHVCSSNMSSTQLAKQLQQVNNLNIWQKKKETSLAFPPVICIFMSKIQSVEPHISIKNQFYITKSFVFDLYVSQYAQIWLIEKLVFRRRVLFLLVVALKNEYNAIKKVTLTIIWKHLTTPHPEIYTPQWNK